MRRTRRFHVRRLPNVPYYGNRPSLADQDDYDYPREKRGIFVMSTPGSTDNMLHGFKTRKDAASYMSKLKVQYMYNPEMKFKVEKYWNTNEDRYKYRVVARSMTGVKRMKGVPRP